MPLRPFDRDELIDNANVFPNTPRVQRLKNLLCGGPWGNDSTIKMIYWRINSDAPGGGHWVAWQGPDPLQE